MKNYQDIQISEVPTIKVGNELLDNLFSSQGGMEHGTLLFLTGTSGAGKTTLCKKLQSLIEDSVSVFYSREMMSQLVKKQTLKLEVNHRNAFITDCIEYPHFRDFMNMINSRNDVSLLIIDSIQHVAADFVSSDKLSVEASMKLVYKMLMDWKNQNNGIVILIGQVTKEGDFQGANFLKHDADAHIHMTFDKKKNIRTIETTKNRMGKLEKLYYEFVDSSETLKFYSESEFENKDQNIKFDDYLLKIVGEYFKSLDKKHKNYKVFMAEFNSFAIQIHKDHVNDLVGLSDYLGSIIAKIQELVLKHGL